MLTPSTQYIYDTGSTETHFENYSEFQNFYKNISNDDHDEIVNFPRFENLNVDKFKYFSVEQFNTEFNQKLDCHLKAININIRGISKNYENLSLYLMSLKVNFDIIMLSETHISVDLENKDIHNLYPLEGYDIFYVRSRIKFGGVIIYVKSCLKAAYVHELTASNSNCDHIYIKFFHNNKPLIIGT